MTTIFNEGTATIGTTEYSLATSSTSLTGSTSPGVYQPVLDLTALTATERYQLTYYEKVVSGGTQIVIFQTDIIGAQAQGKIYPAVALANGWDVTLKKIAGTSRSIPFSIRKAGS